mgnify:CR=1 FL=1
MAKIKRVITAQQREQVRQLDKQKEKEEIKERLGNKAKLTQNDINELVRMLAKEHGLI